MKISKVCEINKFSHFYSGEQTKTHTICVLVDDVCITVNDIILEWWSDEYKNLLEEDENCIFLLEFKGCAEEVKDCLKLLHGIEVDVNFGNIVVLTKFGCRFNIPELLHETLCWFKENLVTDNLVQILSVVSQITEMQLKVAEQLLAIVKDFLLKHANVCRGMLQGQSPDIDNFIVDICLKDVELLKHFITIIPDKISSEKNCERVIDKLEEMLQSNPANMQQIGSAQLQETAKKITSIVESPRLFKKTMEFMNTMLCITLGSTSSTLSQTSVGFQSWRGMTKGEIKALKPNVTEYEFAAIMLDWVESTEPKPSKTDVLELYKEIKQNDLDDVFLEYFKSMLMQEHYTNIPLFTFVPHDKYEHLAVGDHGMTMNELLGFILNNNIIRVSFSCATVEDCTFKFTNNKHVITIQFKTVSDRLEIETVPTKNLTNTEHTHDNAYQYKNWYIFSVAEDYTICPLFSKTCTEIVTFLKDNIHTSQRVWVCGMMLKVNGPHNIK